MQLPRVPPARILVDLCSCLKESAAKCLACSLQGTEDICSSHGNSLSVNLRPTLEGVKQDPDSSLDVLIAPGFRLWMLLALVLLILLAMTVVVCCFIKLRIPRTKREIELNAVRRKLRRRRLLDAKDAQQLTAVLGNQVDHASPDQSPTNMTSAESTSKASTATT